MRKLIVIAFGLLLVMGAGVGAWFFVVQNGGTIASAAALAEDHDPVYVTFNPIQLPLIGANRVEQLINISLALEVTDQKAADRVVAMAPRLNDAFIQALYGALHTNSALIDGALDVAMLKRRLMEVSAHVMGQGVVKDALVQMLTQRQL